MQFLRILYAFIDVLDHGQMVSNCDVAQLFSDKLQTKLLYVSSRFSQTVNQPTGQVFLVVQQKAVLGC